MATVGDFKQADCMVYQRLTTDNSGDLAKSDLAVDGSGAAVTYEIGPPAGSACDAWVINRVVIHYEHSGTWQITKFGSLSALANGCKLEVTRNGSQIIDLTAGEPVKTNGGWGALCYDVTILDSLGSGNTHLNARYSFFKAGHPLLLEVRGQMRLVATIQDDLSAMSHFHIMAQGYTV